MAQIEWYTNTQTRCRYNAKSGTLSIPAACIDESKILGNTIKVLVGIDRENQRLIIKYANNHFKGLNLTRPKNPVGGTAFSMSLLFIPDCDKMFKQGYYNIRVKDDELEIDLYKAYETKY